MMDNLRFSLEVPEYWVLVILLLSVVVSWFFYSKKNMPWPKSINWLLAILRAAALFVLGMIFLNPMMNMVRQYTDKPIVVVLHDNSQSVALRETKERLLALDAWIENAPNQLDDYQWVYRNLSKSDSLGDYTEPLTNLTAPLKQIDELYAGQNLKAVVLASDGIVNQGLSPKYTSFSFPIYTIGVGDPSPTLDLSIAEVLHNDIAYQGNQFPVAITLQQFGYTDQSVVLSIFDGKTLLAEQNVVLKEGVTKTEFRLPAEKEGRRHLRAIISELENETTLSNNKKDFYVEVIEGKERILIVAPAPHPDIAAIRKTIAQSKNYESFLHIPRLKVADLKEEYDVVIYHNAFANRNFKVDVKTGGTWYFLGEYGERMANQELSYLNISRRGNQKDNVGPLYHASQFSKFTLSENANKVFANVPPINVPFGEYVTTGPVEMLFEQRVGDIGTGRPLMLFYDNGSQKEVLTMGDGIWKWRLQEAAMNENTEVFDEWVLKTIQFLSVKANKKHFVVRPRQADYTERTRVYLDVEIYDQIFEPSYGHDVELKLTTENNEEIARTLTYSEVSKAFNLGFLSQGVYKYEARVQLNDKELVERGEFAVTPVQLEELNLRADHQMLQALSENTGAAFYTLDQADDLLQELEAKDFAKTIREEEDQFPIKDNYWLLIIVISLLTIEWFLRKYYGAY